MNRRLLILGSVAVLAFTCIGSAQAQNDISGSLTVDKRFLTSDAEVPMVDFYSKARLELKRWMSEDLLTVVSAEVRFYDLSGVSSPSGLAEPDRQMPFEILPWEIYLKAHNLFVDGLDLTLGKQRITWGTADKLNQTDNLNPDDFSDIFDFGAKVPSTAAMLAYTFPNDWSLTGVWIPSVRPVLLPKAGGFNLGGSMDLSPLLGDAQVVAQEDHLDAGLFDLKHSMQAVKFAWNMMDIDFSVSYFHGYDDLPVPTALTITAIDQDSVGIRSDSSFMEEHIVGLDFAGELLTVGYWAEAAVVFPEGANIKITAPGAGGEPIVMEDTIVKDEAYAKYTVGFDYTFSFGLYLNFQYMHGFFVERDGHELNDYFLGRLEWKFLDDALKLVLGGGYQVSDWDDLSNVYGFFVMPEIVYKPYDNLEIALGAFVVEGKGDGFFSALDDQDQVYFKAKASF
ncbi:MAG: hypothetical protein JRF33_19620 [Deltaproteobacteria bacterium]|nr:hypothetical protein [Deltaproteobacteria bacterium]